MTNNDEQLIKQFLEPYRRTAVPDNGFSHRVVDRLPRRRFIAVHDRLLEYIWAAFCLLVGIVWVWKMQVVQIVWDALRDSFTEAFVTQITQIPLGSLLLVGFIILLLCYKKVASLA